MSIRECRLDDLAEASELAHQCNTLLGQTSSFLYKDLEKVSQSFSESLGVNSVQLVATADDRIVGYLHVVDDAVYGSGDVLGPFVREWNPSVATELLVAARTRCAQMPKLKFNVSPTSPLIPVLVNLGAAEKEHNYSLVLPATTPLVTSPTRHEAELTPHAAPFDSPFIELFDQFFEDSYISAEALIQNSGEEYRLVDLMVERRLVGFVAFRPGIGYLDFVAVHPALQGRGFGKLLLNEAIKQLRRQNRQAAIRLSVDLESVAALRLYRDLGFEVLEEFVSFHLDNRA